MRWTFRGYAEAQNRNLTLGELFKTYRAIAAHPVAQLLLIIVFLEGIAIHGFFPYIASLLAEIGQPRPSVAGLIITTEASIAEAPSGLRCGAPEPAAWRSSMPSIPTVGSARWST